jgi:hypothetical protein
MADEACLKVPLYEEIQWLFFLSADIIGITKERHHIIKNLTAESRSSFFHN